MKRPILETARAGKALGLAIVFASGFAPAAVAQNATKGTCGGNAPVGYIGVSGISCNCTISPAGSGKPWVFRSEPRITSLETDAPAGRLLKPGDVIVQVNGRPITGDAGAYALAHLTPGEPVVLTVRRDGHTHMYALTPTAACPTDSRLLAVHAPSAPQGKAPKAGPPMRTPRAARAPTTPAPSAYAVAPGRLAAYTMAPHASFGMGLSCSGQCAIKVTEKNNTTVMLFTEPPEVYSIERDGPADRAGLRRGDVLTHIDGLPLNEAEGGRRFANAKPGQIVKFTISRAGERKIVAVTTAARATPAPQLARSSESLERARASLFRLQQDQAEQVRKLQDELRKSQRMEEAAVRKLRQAMLDQEREHRTRLVELAFELARTESRLRAAMTDSARAVCQVPLVRPFGVARANRTLRYTGTIGDVDIEVRGADRAVSVTETGDEIEIATAGTTVKLKEAKKK